MYKKKNFFYRKAKNLREKMYIQKSNSNSVLGKTVSHLLMLYRSGFGEFAVSLSSPQNTSSSYHFS